MEHNIVTLETAKRLQAAGFPQEGIAFEWLERPSNRPEYRHELAQTWQSQHISGGFAAPTAQEIADQFSKDIFMGRLANGTYYASCAALVGLGSDLKVVGDTQAEALALLWLKLDREAK